MRRLAWRNVRVPVACTPCEGQIFAFSGKRQERAGPLGCRPQSSAMRVVVITASNGAAAALLPPPNSFGCAAASVEVRRDDRRPLVGTRFCELSETFTAERQKPGQGHHEFYLIRPLGLSERPASILYCFSLHCVACPP